jgi:hypothetical protein
LCCHKGSLNSTNMWYSECLVVMVTGRFKLGNCWGDSHALTIQWVYVGDPLAVHTHYATLPLGNVYEYTILYPTHLQSSRRPTEWGWSLKYILVNVSTRCDDILELEAHSGTCWVLLMRASVEDGHIDLYRFMIDLYLPYATPHVSTRVMYGIVNSPYA